MDPDELAQLRRDVQLCRVSWVTIKEADVIDSRHDGLRQIGYMGGLPVFEVSELPGKEGGEDWHNDATPMEPEQFSSVSFAVWMLVVGFCGGSWIGFLFGLWLES